MDENWPLSNYPIFLTIVLLVTATVTFSMGDEHRAEDFVIYAYYFLVIGIVVCLFDLIPSDNIKSRTINGTKNLLKECRKIEVLFIKIIDINLGLWLIAMRNMYNDIISKLIGMNVYKLFPKVETQEIKSLIDNLRKRIDGQRFPIIVYLSVSLLIWAGINKNYILALDMPTRNSLDNLYFLYLPSIIEFGSMSWIIQRIYLLFSMFLSGYSMYGLSHKIFQLRIASLYAGLLYMINPYIYIRIMTGHMYILLSYAALPLLLMTYIDFLEKKEMRRMIKFAFILTFVSISLHILVLSLIIMIIIFIFWITKNRDIRNIKMIPIVIIIFILLNFYWIFPLVTAKNTIVDNIGEEDYKVFAPKVDNFSDLFNIASMYGFWREGYIYAKDFIPYWQLLSLFIILLAVYGFISYHKDKKIGYIVKALGLIGIIGFILATGINGPFGDVNHWLYDNTILKAFRDSHKFVAMLVFSYAILGGLGINRLKVYMIGCKK